MPHTTQILKTMHRRAGDGDRNNSNNNNGGGAFAAVDTIIGCKICFEEFNDTDRSPLVLDCGHTFCGRCLHLWLNGHFRGQCPMCRSVFYGVPTIRERTVAVAPTTTAATATATVRWQH